MIENSSINIEQALTQLSNIFFCMIIMATIVTNQCISSRYTCESIKYKKNIIESFIIDQYNA